MKFWINKGLSKSAAETMLESWAPSTRKLYNSCLKKWSEFCSSSNINPTDPSIIDIVNFLQHISDRGLGQSAVYTHRAAVSSLLSAIGRFEVEHELDSFLSRFAIGLRRKHPTDPKRAEIWDVSDVLTWIKSLWPINSLPLKIVTLRTVLLVAICAPKRVSELSDLRLDKLRKSKNKWEFRLISTKNRGSSAPHTATLEPFMEDKRLCPVFALESYWSLLPHKPNKAFVSYTKPHNPVTSSTIARWLKEALGRAGIRGYTAHSTRAASTSKAANLGVSAKQIMGAANWSPTGSTFERFYHKSITPSLQKTVLSTVN